MKSPITKPESSRPHRLACAVVCLTFPLMFIGGLVTTTQAGMAVPDWPTTFGYNLFLYPMSTWVAGPWDVFVEHKHRLVGALVGLVTIILMLKLWRCDSRKWVFRLGVMALAAVMIQGILGGLRVRYDDVLLARIHASFGPLFFCLMIAIALFTSNRWREADQSSSQPGGMKLARLAVITTFLVYMQLLAGTFIRHLPPNMHFRTFQIAMILHLIIAAILTLHIILLAIRVWRYHRQQAWLSRPAGLLFGLIILQLCLGCATWVMKYGYPSWLSDNYAFAAGYVVLSGCMMQSLIITSHVAVGHLILGLSFLLSLRCLRLYGSNPLSSGVHQSKIIDNQNRLSKMVVEVAL